MSLSSLIKTLFAPPRAYTPTQRSGARYRCGYCGYHGYCYGAPSSVGVSAPYCRQCEMNNRLIPLA